jgi:hypothetical protein
MVACDIDWFPRIGAGGAIDDVIIDDAMEHAAARSIDAEYTAAWLAREASANA